MLFLDELPEFRRDALEVLRQPMEDGKLTIARGGRTGHLSGRFSAHRRHEPLSVRLVRHKPLHLHEGARAAVSAPSVRPLLDRIDLQITVQPVEYEALAARSRAQEESSETIRARVLAARQRQYDRQGEDVCNAAIPPSLLAEFCPLTDEASAVFRRAFERARFDRPRP